jgi:hypothetical protein
MRQHGGMEKKTPIDTALRSRWGQPEKEDMLSEDPYSLTD